jgi:Domain of Unknown Function (DUF748)
MERRMRRRTKVIIGLSVLVVLLVAARLIAPVYILRYVNNTLAGLDGYTGHVSDIELGIWRGAYVIKDVVIEKTTKKEPLPFVSVERADISVHWKALLHGKIVSEIELLSPKLNILAERKPDTQGQQQAKQREKARVANGQETSWQTQIKQLVPLEINRIGIQGGEFHFRDLHSDPKVDVQVRDLEGEVTNLTNSEDLSNDDMVAHAEFHALALRSGKLHLGGRMDPYAEKPTFHLKAELEQLQIKELNDFLKAYANVDAEKGTLSVYSEVDCKNGRFKGYVKPLMRNLQILNWKDEHEGFFGKLWEGVVEVGKDIFENHSKDQVATRIPLSGNIENPDADIIQTLLQVLQNAFIEALHQGLEPSMGDESIAGGKKQ